MTTNNIEYTPQTHPCNKCSISISSPFYLFEKNLLPSNSCRQTTDTQDRCWSTPRCKRTRLRYLSKARPGGENDPVSERISGESPTQRIHGTGTFTYMYHKNHLNVGKQVNIPYMDGMGKGIKFGVSMLILQVCLQLCSPFANFLQIVLAMKTLHHSKCISRDLTLVTM